MINGVHSDNPTLWNCYLLYMYESTRASCLRKLEYPDAKYQKTAIACSKDDTVNKGHTGVASVTTHPFSEFVTTVRSRCQQPQRSLVAITLLPIAATGFG
jgi:hypothetical protein